MLRTIDQSIDKQLTAILQRTELTLDRPETRIVQRIIKDVKNQGDRAVLYYTRKYDRVTLSELRVDPLEIELAHREVEPMVLKALRTAIKNITMYHVRQVPKSWLMSAGKKSRLGLRYSPMAAAGVYVPGGRAVYPSSVLMNVIPAKLAGVPRVCIVTPPDQSGNVHPLILCAARELGVDEVYRCGGAQSIAALAYGTETIPRVDFIAGPGNIYMTLAKKLLYGIVGVDKLAGPSESLILADKSADPKFVAADLITQAEHDPQASSILICNSMKIAEAVNRQLDMQIKTLKRKTIIEQSFKKYGAIIVISDDHDYIRLTDLIAPEHLQIMLADAEGVMDQINNAGAIFLGNYSPEALGDYMAGPNHVLPTGGTARFASPLGVYDFIKKTSIIDYDKADLKALKQHIVTIAEIEGLDGHANALNVRFPN
jgi:histidinol dehydrogenase